MLGVRLGRGLEVDDGVLDGGRLGTRVGAALVIVISAFRSDSVAVAKGSTGREGAETKLSPVASWGDASRHPPASRASASKSKTVRSQERIVR